MKSLSQKINQLEALEVATKMLLVFVLIYSSRISHHYLFIMTALVISYGVIEKKFFEKPLFWGIVAVFFTTGIHHNFYNTGNHTFVTLYLSLLMLIVSIFRRDASIILHKSARLILGIIMFFAVIQKFVCTTFMNGSSLQYLNNRGDFFRNFHRFFSENQTIIQANNTAINQQLSSYEALFTPIQLESPNWLFYFDAPTFAYIILAVEFLFFLLLFVKNQWLRNGFFTAFVLGLVLTREETGFASLLCILLFLQAQKDNAIFKLVYIGIFGLCISLIISRLGFF